MKKSLLIFPLIFLMGLAPLQSNPSKSVVKILAPSSVCSGIIVSATEGHVLTVRHCVPDDGLGLLINDRPAKIIKVSDTLALLQDKPFEGPPIAVRKSKLKIGEELWSIGYAYNIALTFLRRSFAADLGDDFLLDGTMAGGMSGGPIVDSAGKLVGINQATDKTYNATSVGCGAEEILKFLERK